MLRRRRPAARPKSDLEGRDRPRPERWPEDSLHCSG